MPVGDSGPPYDHAKLTDLKCSAEERCGSKVGELEGTQGPQAQGAPAPQKCGRHCGHDNDEGVGEEDRIRGNSQVKTVQEVLQKEDPEPNQKHRDAHAHSVMEQAFDFGDIVRRPPLHQADFEVFS